MSPPVVQVDDVLRVVADNVEAIERERRLPDTVVAALAASGLNRALIPAVLGGTEAPLGDIVDAVARVAAVDGSAGWCAAIGAGSNVFAGYMPERGAKEVFADPDQGNATMFAPTGTVEHGVLRGRWAFTSNCLHSEWAGLGAVTMTSDGTPEPSPRVVFVPVEALTIEDTWTAAGLRGTGSNHVRAEDIAVDLDRSCHFSDTPWPDGTLWRLPIYTVLIPVLAAVPLGIARGALDVVLATVRDGRVARRGQLFDDPVGLAELAAADTELRAAGANLHLELAAARDLAERGDPVDAARQARILLAGMHACDVAVASTVTAHALAGAAAVFDESPVLRALLDVQTGRQHALFSHAHRAPLIAAAAGRDVVYPPYLN
jgi:alkylation response protein AidB-like acyl-CoA dehydrogenase